MIQSVDHNLFANMRGWVKQKTIYSNRLQSISNISITVGLSEDQRLFSVAPKIARKGTNASLWTHRVWSGFARTLGSHGCSSNGRLPLVAVPIVILHSLKQISVSLDRDALVKKRTNQHPSHLWFAFPVGGSD